MNLSGIRELEIIVRYVDSFGAVLAQKQYGKAATTVTPVTDSEN